MHLIECANGIIDLESALFSVAIRMDYHLLKSFFNLHVFLMIWRCNESIYIQKYLRLHFQI